MDPGSERHGGAGWRAGTGTAVACGSVLGARLSQRLGACGLAVLAAASVAICSAPTAQASVTAQGFITTRDGTQLRYSMIRPDGAGPFPVLINYEGYGAGSSPGDNGPSVYQARLLARGYALVGVSVRGTGCSQGVFDPFAPSMGQDGYDAVEWAARQPWSNGRVGMIGVSFGAITQLLTAADRPPHLLAITPDSATSDLYRDVAYPGGILEYDFVFAWTAIQKGSYAEVVADDTNPQCPVNYAQHEAANAGPSTFIPTLVVSNPFFDDDAGTWMQRAPNAGFHAIDAPTFLFNQWQDEQLPGRIFDSLSMFARPDLLWANFSNGNHGRALYSASDQALILDFLDHFVRGVPNAFPSAVPHLTVAMETAIERNGQANEPAWNIARDSVGSIGARPLPLYLRSSGHLSVHAPPTPEAGDAYAYPLPSSDVTEPGPVATTGGSGHSLGQLTWKGSEPPAGSFAYTSAPLSRDLVVAGPASLDLWMSSTATDTDVQATITEVRPDGQETYVQRGWLRASHRKLDPNASTALRPYQTHLRGDSQALAPGQATPMRLEVFPFAHAFRKGSRVRVWIDAPTGHTGFWAFTPISQSAQNTILHDPAHPSRLVLGQLPGEAAQAPLPACDSLRNQPCRSDPAPNNWTAADEVIPSGLASGATSAGVIGGPTGARCLTRGALRFTIHQNNGRVTRVTYRISGQRARTLRGRRIRRLRVLAPRGKTEFSVRIVAFTVKGKRVVSVRYFMRCAGKTPPRTVVRHRGARSRR